MLSRARVGLLVIGIAASPWALAHGSGVSHTYENGQPVITVRLVPDEAAVANAKRIDALEPGAIHATPAGEPSPDMAAPNMAAPDDAAPPAAETAEPVAADEFAVPETPDAAVEIDAPGETAAAPRYPSARPALKPNTETGVGGVLDLTPPPQEPAAQPRPMRLNSVDRPRRVADRASQKPAREQRPRQQRVRAPQPEAPAIAAPAPDPLDEAFVASAADQPSGAMNLSLGKDEARVAGGN